MSETFVIPKAKPAPPNLQFLRLVPGVLLLAAIGYAGKLLEQNVGTYAKAHHWIFPNIEYVLWAIILGLAISNTVGVPAIFSAGVATYEFWLKAGIVLLTFAGVGLRTNFREMRKQGLRPFAVGAIGEVVIAVFTLGLVMGAQKIWGL